MKYLNITSRVVYGLTKPGILHPRAPAVQKLATVERYVPSFSAGLFGHYHCIYWVRARANSLPSSVPTASSAALGAVTDANGGETYRD